jgi:hypothetical protein
MKGKFFSRKDAKTQSAAAFLKAVFLAPLQERSSSAN